MQGYTCKAPNQEVEQIDAEIVAKMKCRRCKSQMRYEPWTKPGSYVALAVCPNCGAEVEF